MPIWPIGKDLHSFARASFPPTTDVSRRQTWCGARSRCRVLGRVAVGRREGRFAGWDRATRPNPVSGPWPHPAHRAICPATAQRPRCWGELSVPPDHLKVGVETFYKLTCLVSVTAGGVEQRRGPRCGSRRRARKGANGVESVFVAEYAVMSSDVPCGRGSRGPLGGPLHPVGTRLRTASRREPRAGPPLVVKEGPAAIRAGAERQRLNGLDYPCGEWASFAVPERANGSDRGTESYPRPSGIECNTNSLKE